MPRWDRGLVDGLPVQTPGLTSAATRRTQLQKWSTLPLNCTQIPLGSPLPPPIGNGLTSYEKTRALEAYAERSGPEAGRQPGIPSGTIRVWFGGSE